MSTKRILTGIKATGTPHIGNYFGMFEPALTQLGQFDESFMFVANYHSLNQIQDANTLRRLTQSITATWLACGLDTSKTALYAQSDVPEVFELETILNAFTPKGWMNKAHAYKAAVDKNTEAQKNADEDISMGLYTYPVLMAADILLYNADVVPVGKDQIQHVEIARDIAQKINNHYNQELFVLPQHVIKEEVGTIVGVDGRKMSKSYNNIIPLFETPEERQKTVNQIVTDSSLTNENKVVEGTALYDIYRLVSSDEEAQQFKVALEEGQVGWGDAKKELAQKLDDKFAEMTHEYNRLMEHPAEISQALEDGAAKVRPIAQETIERVRLAIGIM